VPVYWQWKLVDVFYPEITNNRNPFVLEWYNCLKSGQITKESKEIQQFLLDFLPKLYATFRADVLLTPNIRHLCDLDWLYATKLMGVPVVVLWREPMLLTAKTRDGVAERWKKFKIFLGHHIVVPNQTIRDVFLKHGFVHETEISVCGSLKLDNFANKLKELRIQEVTKKHKRVLLCYFRRDSVRMSEEFSRLHDDTIDAFIELANELPDIEFIIKPKQEHLGKYKFGGTNTKRYEMNLDILPKDSCPNNLSIQPFTDIQEIVISADVICGFYSTVLLEAALAGKPVVIPLFRYFRETKIASEYPFLDHLHLFSVAETKLSLKKMIKDSLVDQSVSDNLQVKRKDFFVENLSRIDGQTLANTLNTIELVVERQKGVLD
jgi:hypothetical protein